MCDACVWFSPWMNPSKASEKAFNATCADWFVFTASVLNDKQQQVCVAEHSQHKHKAFAEKCGKHLIQKTGGLKFNYVCWFVGCSGNSQAQEAVNSRRVKEFRICLCQTWQMRDVSLSAKTVTDRNMKIAETSPAAVMSPKVYESQCSAVSAAGPQKGSHWQTKHRCGVVVWVAADRLCSFTADVTEQSIADVSLQPAPNFTWAWMLSFRLWPKSWLQV